MHELERSMAEVLATGRHPNASDLGGLAGILAEADMVAGSPFSPEFLSVVLDASDRDDTGIQAFISAVTGRPRNDIALAAMVDTLAARAPLADGTERHCFRSWLRIATDRRCSTSLRTAALRGAFLMKGSDARRGSQLAGEIAATEMDDDASYVSHAARIGGLLYSETPNPGIVEFLNDALGVGGAADEAAFELGMIEIRDAFAVADPASAKSRIEAARRHFDTAVFRRESRSDAKVLSLALGLLTDFDEGRPGGLAERLREVARAAFAYAEYDGYEDGFLSGAKATHVAAWTSLALRLGKLTESLREPAWLDAKHTIEEELLVVYSASRTIFRRSADGGLEWLVRPRIERTVRSTEGQLHLLRCWLRAEGDAELGEAAQTLLARTEAALADETSPDPSSAATLSPTVAAILQEGCIPHDIRRRITASVIAAANAVEMSHVSRQIEDALATVDLTFRKIPEFEDDVRARRIVMAIVWKALLFLESRLDMTVGQDATVAYLFARPGQPDPVERDLQQDFMRHFRTANFGTMDELRGVGGGRADIAHKVEGIRFITEVKREFTDASFENLLAAYGDQTVMYQGTNLPISMLLVLDLTTREGRPDHISKLYHAKVGDLFHDGTLRGVVILRLPGRRIAPSEATKCAAKTKSKPRTSNAKQQCKRV